MIDFKLYFRTLPAEHFEKISEAIKEYGIQGLLIVGGFEV